MTLPPRNSDQAAGHQYAPQLTLFDADSAHATYTIVVGRAPGADRPRRLPEGKPNARALQRVPTYGERIASMPERVAAAGTLSDGAGAVTIGGR